MIRSHIERGLEQDPDFAWRGRDVSRLENLSDIVFALALGIIVSPSLVPVSFEDLLRYLLGIVPAAAGFFVMLQIWNAHYLFFRRYDLRDGRVVFLNALLLLFVLFLAYPIRFSFDALFGWVQAMLGYTDRLEVMRVNYDRAGKIIAIYAGGYAIVSGIFAMMYRHAGARAEAIGLTAREKRLTDEMVAFAAASALVCLVVAPLAAFTVLGGFAGFALNLTFPIRRIIRHHYDRRAAKAEAASPTSRERHGPQTSNEESAQIEGAAKA